MNIYSFTCAIREQNYLWIFRWIIYGSDGAYILFKYAVWDDYKDNLVEFTMAYRPVDIHPASTLTCHGLIVPVWKKELMNQYWNSVCSFWFKQALTEPVIRVILYSYQPPDHISHTKLQPSSNMLSLVNVKATREHKPLLKANPTKLE